MKMPLSWLADYVELPADTKLFAHQLTMSGLEVEALEEVGTPAGPETVFETSPTSNRGDLLSLVGASRLVHAVTGGTVKPIDVAFTKG
mgnify:FL=1